MTKYTNAQIADDLNLWDEYFNTSAVMTDEEFHAMSFEERLQMLNDAYGDDNTWVEEASPHDERSDPNHSSYDLHLFGQHYKTFLRRQY